MALVIPNIGAPWLLRFTLGLLDANSIVWRLKLYQNNYTPAPGSLNANFTEADFTGYNDVRIDPSLWSDPTIISDRAASSYLSGTPVVFNNAGSAQTIFGYYVIKEDDNAVLFAEKFAVSRTLNTGDDLDLTLNFNGGTQT